MEHRFIRTELVLGAENLQRLQAAKVAVVGLGGVGGHAAEALARSGVGTLILIDHDLVAISNLNRQIVALEATIGRPKVEVMAERIAQINPACRVIAHQAYYSRENHQQLLPEDLTFVADAIDSVRSKVDLIEACLKQGIPLISSLGAGNKVDPTRLKVADISQTHTCPLARAVRGALRKRGIERGVAVVFSDERTVGEKSRFHTWEHSFCAGSCGFGHGQLDCEADLRGGLAMDLFEQSPLRHEHAPLAVRMRPESLEEYVGQEHILGPGKLLRRAISEDILRSLILYGPPGSGKTTLGYVISRTTKGVFVNVSATTTGAAELKRLAEEARDRRAFHGQRTILFVDEIQRLNKAQQDVLLPAVEKGDLILIGATTENPYFEVNAALLSRSQIYQLQPLEEEHLLTLARRALEDPRGLGDVPCQVSQEALRHLARIANGDARVLLNNLEFAVLTTLPNEAGVRLVDLAVAEEAAQAQRVRYDKAGDQHYDVISAFIKSLRGSDPDAALYWYARMVYAGEDPRFVVRRLLVHAAEDVGMADPTALLMAQAAGFALEWLGMPEARIPIAQAIIYIATAPKSNSVIKAVDAALAAVEKTGAEPVPVHLRDTHYAGAAKLGHGRGYRYPHDYPHHYVVQEYLPENMKGFRVYEPSEQGREKVIKERLAYFAKLKEAHQRQEP